MLLLGADPSMKHGTSHKSLGHDYQITGKDLLLIRK
jgi:hypothetical protein